MGGRDEEEACNDIDAVRLGHRHFDTDCARGLHGQLEEGRRPALEVHKVNEE